MDRKQEMNIELRVAALCYAEAHTICLKTPTRENIENAMRNMRRLEDAARALVMAERGE